MLFYSTKLEVVCCRGIVTGTGTQVLFKKISKDWEDLGEKDLEFVLW